MTTIERTRVLAPAETTAPLPALPVEPLAPWEKRVTVDELLARLGLPPVQRREVPLRTVARWLLWAILLPVLFASVVVAVRAESFPEAPAFVRDHVSGSVPTATWPTLPGFGVK